MNYYGYPPPDEMFRPPPYSSHGVRQPPGIPMAEPGQPSLVNVQPQFPDPNEMTAIGGQNEADKTPYRGEMNYYYGQQYPQMYAAPPPAYYGPPLNPPLSVTMTDPVQPPSNWSLAQPRATQNVVIINAEGQHYPNHQTYTGAFCYSCFVMWFCNWPFGLVAFILAAMASNRAVSDPPAARRYGRASYGMSNTGLTLTIILQVRQSFVSVSNTGLTLTIIIIIVIVSASVSTRRRNNSANACNYFQMSTCYTFKNCFYTRDTCVYSYSGYYALNNYCCYYNYP